MSLTKAKFNEASQSNSIRRKQSCFFLRHRKKKIILTRFLFQTKVIIRKIKRKRYADAERRKVGGLWVEAAQGSNYRRARWAAVPNLQRAVPGPSDGHRFDIRQSPAVCFVALTLPMQQTARPSPHVQPFPGTARPRGALR